MYSNFKSPGFLQLKKNVPNFCMKIDGRPVYRWRGVAKEKNWARNLDFWTQRGIYLLGMQKIFRVIWGRSSIFRLNPGHFKKKLKKFRTFTVLVHFDGFLRSNFPGHLRKSKNYKLAWFSSNTKVLHFNTKCIKFCKFRK